ncbi:META domain-containing protein [Pedobacter sp. SD-b]|uniref:META domain-containing protein n=1 Tax=Pedobacter segetis TaxID=2793069 RepID=A0ABS1BFG0_9SPHI|nr:META domain-containing protein [Pedobacter segetis]MBK0381587.1 META domain-containing protein [Pedobacter segetis]
MKANQLKFMVIGLLAFIIGCTNSKPSSTTQKNLDSANIKRNTDDTIQNLPSVAEKITSIKADITKMKWNLIFFSGIKNETEPFKNEKATIKFNNDGTFNAKFCNNMSGSYVIDEEKGAITLSKIIATKMLCQGNLMKAEDGLKEGTYQMDITKGRLSLNAKNRFFTFDRESTPTENPMAN